MAVFTVPLLLFNDLSSCHITALTLLRIILLKAHGGKHACPFCEGTSTLAAGIARTFGSLKRRLFAFDANGSKLKDAQHFANVIHPCLLHFNDERLIIDVIPPPPLHLLIGGTNAIMSVIIQLKGTTALLASLFGQRPQRADVL